MKLLPPSVLRALALALAPALLACASSSAADRSGDGMAALGNEPVVGDTPTPLPKVAEAAETCADMTPQGVRREAVLRTVSAGLGFWLRGVKVRARTESGKFRGWIVDSLFPGDVCYAQIDLKTGDVVKRVNGKPVEREGQAFDVFIALRTAPEIVVDYERDGIDKTMRLGIVDAP